VRGFCFTVLLNRKPTAQEVAEMRDCAKNMRLNVDEGDSRSRYVVAPEQRTRESRSPGEAFDAACKAYATPHSPPWSARLSPSALLKQQRTASAIQLAGLAGWDTTGK
jgi:hypothetical protein